MLRRFQPRIIHKGLILLAVPLLFALVVGAVVVYLQHYYGESLKAEGLRKQILYHTNELWFWNMNMTTTNLSAAFLGRSPYWETADRAVSEYVRLRKLIAQDPKQLEQLDKIKLSHDQSYRACRELKPCVSDSGGRLAQILALRTNLLTCKRLVEGDVETGNLIRSFREYELRQSARAAEKVRKIAWFMEFVLAGAIVGSAVISYLLFRYFMQGIYRGVQALMLNIQRFKTGQALAPALEGTDEIALLDANFHEMADEVALAHRMKQAFLSTLSDELSAPIESVRDCLTRLSRGSLGTLSEEATLRAQKAERTLDRLIELMSDMLALQAPGPGRVEILPRTCTLAEVINTSIDAVSALADKNGVRLEGRDTQGLVYADPDRIVQVLVNLLSNAIKFSSRGSSVAVSAVQFDDQVEVRVKDMGRGVPAHLRAAIFERFEQVAASDATEKGGSGLGLPICKEIVELHGGSIGVESEEGEGSTFWFRLPACASTKE